MSILDDPDPDFEADNEWLHALLGLCSAGLALDEHSPVPGSADPGPGADDPVVLAFLGLLALRGRLQAELPGPSGRRAAPRARPAAMTDLLR
jgi:hypothetical protein